MRVISTFCISIFLTSTCLAQSNLVTRFDSFPNLTREASPVNGNRHQGRAAKNSFITGAGFSTPDTVCVNTPVNITNTSVGSSSYYWNFCVANSATNPVGTNLGNLGFNTPVFTDYAKDGDNYYAFVSNNFPGKVVRLDFGNSLLNIPTVHDFGNFNGVIPDFCEGIQVVKNEGKWYAIIVGGQPVGRIVKVDFGATLSNNSPVATNWGNIGNLTYPHDLYVFDDNGEWYGLTLNSQTNSITRFHFTNSFDNTPSGTNLGNIGGLNYPTGIYAINQNGQWYAFVTNEGGDTGNLPTASLTRLDFGSSLLNPPVGTNLGNPGDALRSARDLTIYQSCNEIFGFIVNYSSANDIVRLNFNNSLTSVPTAVSIGNTGNLSFPHCISKVFRVGNDLYSFVTNVTNNTITRLKFSGCNNASIASSTLQNPPVITYNAPGTYNINLTTDDGLATQSTFCRQVVVVPNMHTPLQYKNICMGDSVALRSSAVSGNEWSTGSTASTISVKASGFYWVKSTNASGCVNIDSFSVLEKPRPVVNLGPDRTICSNDSLVLDAGNAGASYLWQNGQVSQKQTIHQAGLYSVIVANNGCSSADTVTVTILPLPTINITGKTSICKDGRTELTANGGMTYSWSPTTGLSNPQAANTYASPAQTTKYFLTAFHQNGCAALDSVTITVTPKPVFRAISSKPVLCKGDSAILSASGGDKYIWTPADALGSPFGNTTFAYPNSTTTYKVVIEESNCAITDSLILTLPVAEKPSVATTKSNDINCIIGEATLSTGGGSQYLWQPSTGLSDPRSSHPTVRINTTTTYHLFVTTSDGCLVEDSITVYVSRGDDGSSFPVPSAFTPNGDGKNDCFGVKHFGLVKNFSLNIFFYRWGELLFHAEDPFKCWDGMYNGKPQPGEVYVYWIKAETGCGSVFRKGTFVLIR